MESIGRYRFVRELGRGGMGTVFEAVDPYLDRTIAIKVITDKTASLREQLFREARSAGKLNHPGIVTIFDVGEENGIAYIAMELIDGSSLQDILTSGQKLDYAKALDIVTQAAAALDYAHARGIIHRDIKPANIMLKKGGQVSVVDFGIAKIVEPDQHTRTTVVAGTPSYMAPEQIQGQGVANSSDQFSLAVGHSRCSAGWRRFAPIRSAVSCIKSSMESGLRRVRGTPICPVPSTMFSTAPWHSSPRIGSATAPCLPPLFRKRCRAACWRSRP